MCNTGYIIAGEKYSTCQNGTWDTPVPKCVRASCTKVNPPIHGLIYPSHRGAVLNFFCRPGYELHGPNATYCDGRTWDNGLPACLPSNTKPSLSCDFENEDLCGWNQDLRHDFDWTRMNFKTPSGHLGTGPSFDHSKGVGKDGYYMYIESSSRNTNDTARLISPIYTKMDEPDVCLEFYYHMHGASTGQLRVYIKKASDSWDLDPNKALFWKSGNHGDKWLQSLHQIDPIDEDFQIVIEGVRGESYFSDIAIDDVRIIQNCALDDDITTENDVTYPDDYQYQSCLNRCDNDNYIIPPEDSLLMKCGCDETCTDNNACCPDYIAICILGVTDDITTTEEYTTTSESTTITEKETTISTTKSTTMNITQSQLSSSTTPQQNYTLKNRTQPNSINTNEISSVLPKFTITNTTNYKPSVKFIPTNTTNFNNTIKPDIPVRKIPTLVFLTPTTPELIVQRIKSTLMTSTTSTSTSTMSTTATTPKAVKKVTKSATTPGIIDEILTLPEVNEDDVDITYFPSVYTTAKQQVSNSLPIKQSPNDIKVLSSNSKSMQKIIKNKPATNTKLIIILVVASVSFILFTILSGIFVVRRYRRFGCRNRRKMYGSSSDSQSDVRFLTSDEILDFNLAYPEH
ncbi:hypothetical protein ILUMI_23386 [Ignelater luminosus]|uniref:Uncharacterized protein n=1 Tax=Ignelater luminosus TaxID=2038154 RepID=A0A8K0CB63_IGNLU|nr:hypothetical protein ILUMI_23386 [Ignelater luminosus]